MVYAMDDRAFREVRLAVLVNPDDHCAGRADVDRVHHAARDAQQPKELTDHRS